MKNKKVNGIQSWIVERKTLVLIIIAAVVVAGALFYFFYLQNPRFQVLAKVNGTKITVEKFNQNIDKSAEPMVEQLVGRLNRNVNKDDISVMKDILKENSDKVLAEMIRYELLLEEAKKEGFSPVPKTYKDTEKEMFSTEESVIQQYSAKKFPTPPVVTPQEVEKVYNAYKDQMQGISLKQAAPGIEEVLRLSKRQQAIEQLKNDLQKDAKITINEKLLQRITPRPPKTNTAEDFKKAITSGKFVLVDFGANSNPYCRLIRPALTDIKKEYSGKIRVLVIDSDTNQNLAVENKIMGQPTLVFFDTKGQEVFRQVGPMEKDNIVAKLKEMGME